MLAPTARKPLPRLPLCTTSGPRTAHSATPQQAGHPSRRRCSPAPTRREGAGTPYLGYWQVPAPPRSLLLLELHGHLLQRRLPQLLLVAHERLGFNGTGRMHVAAAGGDLVLDLRSDQHRAQVIADPAHDRLRRCDRRHTHCQPTATKPGSASVTVGTSARPGRCCADATASTL